MINASLKVLHSAGVDEENIFHESAWGDPLVRKKSSPHAGKDFFEKKRVDKFFVTLEKQEYPRL